jgi:hypothetical protein
LNKLKGARPATKKETDYERKCCLRSSKGVKGTASQSNRERATTSEPCHIVKLGPAQPVRDDEQCYADSGYALALCTIVRSA